MEFGFYVVIHLLGEALPGHILILPARSNLPVLVAVNISMSNRSGGRERAWAAGVAATIAVITWKGVLLVMSAPTRTQLSSIEGEADAEESNATASPTLAPRARGASSRRDQLPFEHR